MNHVPKLCQFDRPAPNCKGETGLAISFLWRRRASSENSNDFNCILGEKLESPLRQSAKDGVETFMDESPTASKENSEMKKTDFVKLNDGNLSKRKGYRNGALLSRPGLKQDSDSSLLLVHMSPVSSV